MKHLIIAITIVVLFVSVVHAEVNEPPQVLGKYSFYGGTALGTMAYLPNVKDEEVAKSAYKYDVMFGSGSYVIPKSQRYCFVINHRGGISGEKSYVGVSVISFLSDSDGHREPTQVFHNKGFARKPNDPEYESLSNKKKTLRLSVDEFFLHHRKENELLLFDKKLGAKWHGLIKESKVNSWDKKYNWDLAKDLQKTSLKNKYHPPLTSLSPVRIDALLLSFTTTQKYWTEKPVIFCFSGDKGRAAYIRTFSPVSNDFEKYYYFTFVD